MTSEFIYETEFRVDHLAVMNNDMRIQIPASNSSVFLGRIDVFEGTGKMDILYRASDKNSTDSKGDFRKMGQDTISKEFPTTNIEGKPEIFLPYVGGFPEYVKKCQNPI